MSARTARFLLLLAAAGPVKIGYLFGNAAAAGAVKVGITYGDTGPGTFAEDDNTDAED